MGNDGNAGHLAVIVHADHHGDGAVKASGGHLNGAAIIALVGGGDQTGVVGEFLHFLTAAGKHSFNGVLGLLLVLRRDTGRGNGVDRGEDHGHHGGDGQQGQGNAKNIFHGGFGFHFFAASFLGAPNFTGRPILSSSTAQAFMHRMA